MVQEAVAHIQTAPRFVFQLMPFIVSQNIHFNRQFQYDDSIYVLMMLLIATTLNQSTDKKLYAN